MAITSFTTYKTGPTSYRAEFASDKTAGTYEFYLFKQGSLIYKGAAGFLNDIHVSRGEMLKLDVYDDPPADMSAYPSTGNVTFAGEGNALASNITITSAGVPVASVRNAAEFYYAETIPVTSDANHTYVFTPQDADLIDGAPRTITVPRFGFPVVPAVTLELVNLGTEEVPDMWVQARYL